MLMINYVNSKAVLKKITENSYIIKNIYSSQYLFFRI